jgi:hypothetical protein
VSIQSEVIADVAELKANMEIALQGVSNFREFQLKSAKTDGYLKALATVWSLIFAVILTAGGYALKTAYPVIKAIVDEYYQRHPAVTERLKQEQSSTEKLNAFERPQISTIPPLAR